MTMRTSLGFGLALAALLAPPARAAPAPPPDVTLLARRAFLEIGLPPVKPTPAESVLAIVPHPWPGVAMALTVAGTALPVLIVTGSDTHQLHESERAVGLMMFVFTPAAGHVYGGVVRDAWPGLVLRGAGAGLLAGLAIGVEDTSWNEGAVLGVLGGGAMLLTGAVWDVFTVASSVEKRNREIAEARLRLGVRPAADGGAPMLVAHFTF